MATAEKPVLGENGHLKKDDQQPMTPRPGHHKLFVISGRCGRMGNRIILFANFIALAEEQGHRVINPTFHSYAGFFEAMRRDIYCQYPPATRRSWLDIVPGVGGAIRGTRIFFHAARAAGLLNEHHPIFGKRIFTLRQSPTEKITALDGPEVQAKIRDARIIFVNGWTFRAPGLVARHAEKIKSYFRPVAGIEQASRRAVDGLRQHADIVVGVHVRHGDFANWRGGKFFFPASRYAAWMRELAEQFPGGKVAFFVCSDEPRHESEFPGLRVGIGAGSAVGDMYALANCDYIIGPFGTFSMWASFYGHKPLFHIHGIEARIKREEFSVPDLTEIP